MRTLGHQPRRSFYLLAERGTGWWVSDPDERRITKIAEDAMRYDNYPDACRGALDWMVNTGRVCKVLVSAIPTEADTASVGSQQETTMPNHQMRRFDVEISLSGDPDGHTPRKATLWAPGQLSAIQTTIKTELLPSEEDLIRSIKVEETPHG